MSTWLWHEIFEQPISALVSLSLIVCYIWSEFSQGDPNSRKEELSFQYERIINNGQYYRLITSAFLHGNFLHLALNLSTCWSLGTEKIFGSLVHLEISLLFLCLCGLVHLLCAKLAKSSQISYIQSEISGTSIGYSSVVFALSTLVTFSEPNAIHSVPIIGITLPTILVPVFNLVVTHILIPNASILGHCSGILVGFMFGMLLAAGIDFLSLLNPWWIFPGISAYIYVVLGSQKNVASVISATWGHVSSVGSIATLCRLRPRQATIMNGVVQPRQTLHHGNAIQQSEDPSGVVV